MPAKFADGVSLHSTRTTAKPAVGHKAETHKGMRGFIKTTQDASNAGLLEKGSRVGPHKEGPIGKHGKERSSGYMDGQKFRGSSDKSYRATSTGVPGKIVSNKHTPISRSKFEAEGPSRGEAGGFRQYGSGASKTHFKAGGVHSGKMESLRGRAKTSWER